MSQARPKTASVELTPAESHALFERKSQSLLGLSRADFLTGYTAGELDANDASVDQLLMLLPFAEA